MGGQITVESEVGRGSAFRFCIQFEKPTSPACEPPLRNPSALQGLSVLVVDDNETNRRVLSGLLRLWNMRPKTVDGGPAAIEELRRSIATGEAYSLMLVD